MAERPIWPSSLDVIESLIERHAGEMFVALPGAIQAYDSDRQVADVVVGVRNPYPDPEGSADILREDFPVVAHVPVIFPRCGPWFMAMSIAPGTKVQLLVNTLAIGHWRVGDGGITDPADTRRQHLAHAVALIGLDLAGNALRHAPPFIPADSALAGLTLGSDIDEGTRQRFKGDGAVVVEHGTAPVFRIDPGAPTGAPQAVALAPLVAALAQSLKDHFASWVPVVDNSGASLKTHMATWDPPSVAALLTKAT